MEKRILKENDPNFEQVLDIYFKSFPSFERRALEEHKKAMKEKNFICTYYLEEGQIAGILFYWIFGEKKYIEFFAVNENRRGKQVGSRILKEFLEDGKQVILEIEPPIDELTKRRQRFYERHGFILNDYPFVHPSFLYPPKPHALKLMSTGKKLSEEEFKQYLHFMDTEVLKYKEGQ